MGFDCFFAVTQNSLYMAALDERGSPYLVKLLGHDQGTEASPANRLSGDLLAVAAVGLFFYHQDFSPFSAPRIRPQRPEEVNVSHWSGGTSGIVALFADYSSALRAYRQADGLIQDPRWRTHTELVLAAIGQDHPKFVLSDHANLRFRYADA
jgi:hypothetical protein